MLGIVSPRLPREMERYIFELAALEDRNCALQLVLVAKRVQVWYVINTTILNFTRI
jgi:hypothetical protein